MNKDIPPPKKKRYNPDEEDDLDEEEEEEEEEFVEEGDLDEDFSETTELTGINDEIKTIQKSWLRPEVNLKPDTSICTTFQFF